MQTHDTDSGAANRLIDETSPYLLQHAHNPVDWYAWGPEAFEAARRRDVPIFLSIGYSTCYWCHVMERESFEDPETARLMNDRFVCVKVDREERPEVDDVYMTATQLMTGSGGWPMSVFLEPETLRPFWCGTYFPPEPAHGRPSFGQVLLGMSDVWANKRDEALEQASSLGDAVRENLGSGGEPVALGPEQIGSAVSVLLQMYDRTEGGFGGAPKFPQPVYGLFLLAARPHVDEQTRGAIDHALRHTLDRMAVGGLFDQVGGGFHRYCVDGTWTVPHFEKMLYDNAQLLSLYSRAAELYDDAFYRGVVRRTVGYLAREMTSDGGGLFSAQDAEVDGREGLNYLWTPDEVGAVLGEEDRAFALRVYGLDLGPNFTDPHHPEDGPKNVLRLGARPEKVASEMGIGDKEFEGRLGRVNAELLAARDRREQPGLDDKVLAAWNGMAVVGLVDAARALGETGPLDAAERAAGFLLQHMRAADGRMLRSYRKSGEEGRVSHAAGLEDHAWVVGGLLALHGAGRGDGAYLEQAKSLVGVMDAFRAEDGGYTDTDAERDDLFVRARSTYDGATPSAIGVAIAGLVSLHGADPEGPWLGLAKDQLRVISRAVADRPISTVNSVGSVIRVMELEGGASGLAFGDPVSDDVPVPDETSSARVVEIFSDEEQVTVSDGEPAVFTLGFRIRAGYHILAAEPALSEDAGRGLIPLRVGLVSGHGVAVYAEYPEGEPYGAAIVGRDELLVHTGELRLRVVIEKQPGVGAGKGHPVLGVTFQACDDSSCLRPSTIELGVGIRIE